MGAETLVDFAALDSATTDTTVDNTDTTQDMNTDTTSDATETTTEGSESTEGNAEQTEEQKAEAQSKKETTATTEEKTTPKTISEALKALKSDPKNAGASKVLRDAYFGQEAYRKTFPTVQEARAAKEFIEAVGGAEGWEHTQSVLSNIEETDSLVRAGDPKIWENIVEDLRGEGRLDALPKLASGGLDSLKATNKDQYEEVIAPHVLEGLKIVNLPGAITALSKYLAVAEKELTDASYAGGKNGLSALKTIAGDMKSWIDGLMADAKTKEEATTKPDPEREKFLKEKQEFENQKTTAEQTKAKEFKENVALECDKYSNRALGSELKGFLKQPYFKAFGRENLISLGNEIKQNLFQALEKDSAYQIQMKSMWKQKSPDRAKISAFHNSKLDAIAKDIVESTINTRYPNWAKGGSAAGRVAAAQVKKETSNKVADTSVSSGKPTYVAAKPKTLVRESVTINGKEYSPNDLIMLEIGGKGFVKNAAGKFAYVTWRR
jgi:hypothetical protein